MGEKIRVALAAALRAERAAKKIRIVDLARAVGIAERTAIRQLNGQRDIDVPVLDRYAAALGVKTSDLMRDAERRENDVEGIVIHGRFGRPGPEDLDEGLALDYDPEAEAVAYEADEENTDEQ